MNDLDKVLYAGILNPKILSLLKDQKMSTRALEDFIEELPACGSNPEIISLITHEDFKEIFPPSAQRLMLKDEKFSTNAVFEYLQYFSEQVAKDFLQMSFTKRNHLQLTPVFEYLSKQTPAYQFQVATRILESSTNNFILGHDAIHKLLGDNYNAKDRTGTPYYFRSLTKFNFSKRWALLTSSDAPYDLSLRTANGQNLLEYYITCGCGNNVVYVNESHVKKCLTHPLFKDSRTLIFSQRKWSDQYFKKRWAVEESFYSLLIKHNILHERLDSRKCNKDMVYNILAQLEEKEKMPLADLKHETSINALGIRKKHGLRQDVASVYARLSQNNNFFDYSFDLEKNAQISGIKLRGKKYNTNCKLVRDFPEIACLVLDLTRGASFKKLQKTNPNLLNVKKVDNLSKKFKEIKKNQPEYFLRDNKKYQESDHLIPFRLSYAIQSSKSLGDLALKILGKNTGFAQKIVSGMIKNKQFNFRKLFWCQMLTEADYNYDLVSTLAKSRHVSPITYAVNVSLYLKELKEYVPEARVVSWLTCAVDNPKENNAHLYSDTIKDSIFALTELAEHFISKEVIAEKLKEAKNLTDVHDVLSDIIENEIDQDDYPLNQEELTTSLIDKTIGPLSVWVPQMNFDLIKMGSLLDICVGNGSYGDKIQEGEGFIIALVDKTKTPVFCVELDKYFNPVQCRGKFNRVMDRTTESSLRDLIKNAGLN